MDKKNYYHTIQSKIQSLKEIYPSLRKESDEHIFTVLCIKSNFYNMNSWFTYRWYAFCQC